MSDNRHISIKHLKVYKLFVAELIYARFKIKMNDEQAHNLQTKGWKKLNETTQKHFLQVCVLNCKSKRQQHK